MFQGASGLSVVSADDLSTDRDRCGTSGVIPIRAHGVIPIRARV
jgi:hypothetical protein